MRRRPLQVTLLVYSQRGELLNWESRQIRLAIRPDQLQAASTTGIPFHLQIDTPPGDTYLRAGIYDATSGHSGTLEIPLREVLGY